MADLQVLKTELTTDPLTRGYAGMTDQQAADDLNTKYRTRNRTTVPSYEVLAALAPTEVAAFLTAGGNDLEFFKLLVGMSEVPLNASNINTIILNIFDNATFPLTRANLIAIKTNPISRAQELGFGAGVGAGDVGAARNLP